MKKKTRKTHRKIAPLLSLPLFVTALSGMGYRLGRSWLGGSDAFGDWMMTLHEGRYLGKPLVPIYVLLVGLGLLGLLTTGMFMAVSQRRRAAASRLPKPDHRWLHRVVAPIAALPLLATTLTGMAYRVGRAWFNLADGPAHVLMVIHQGSWLGSTLRPFYVLLLGLSLLAMLVTGVQMTGLWPQRKQLSPKQEQEVAN